MLKTRTQKPQTKIRVDRIDNYLNYTFRNERIEAGYTMRELAEIVGVSTPTICNYERLRTTPEDLVARNIAIALNEKLKRTNNLEDYIAYLFPERLKKYVKEINDERKGFPKDALTHAVPLNAKTKRQLPYSPDDPVENTQNSNLTESISKVMQTLTYNEREVIKLRMGLGEMHTCTQEEIARMMNISRERIRQIEAKALRKLQQPLRSRRLIGFLD